MGLAARVKSNPDRAELETLIRSLIPPPNYRVTLDVDRDTEKLILKISKADPWELRLWGFTLWRHRPNWDSIHLVQRYMTARTYAGLLAQLREAPEFLEFEIVSEGCVSYRESVPLTL